MIIINYWAVLVCGVLSMVLGAIWYGPLFGRKWAQIIGANPDDLKACKEMQKRAMPLYVAQFLLTLFQVWVLAYDMALLKNVSGLQNAIWLWAGFVMPTVAGSAMWNNDSAKISWARFLIQAGYQLILFIIFGLVLGMWQ